VSTSAESVDESDVEAPLGVEAPLEVGAEPPRSTPDLTVTLLNPKSFVQILGLVLASLAVLWLIGRLRELLVILVASLFFSFALEPAVNFLARHGMRRGLATGLTFLGVLLIAGVFISAIVPAVIGQVSQFIQSAPHTLQSIAEWAQRVPGASRFVAVDPATQSIQIQEGLRQWLLGRAEDVVSAGTLALGILFKLMMIFFFTFYLVADGPRFRRRICSLLPPERQRVLLHVWEISIQRTGGFIYSKLLLGTISSIAHSVFFLIIGVPYPLAMGIWMGFVSQFIPVIGTYLAVAVPLVVATLARPALGLLVLAFVFIFQQIENYFVSPKLSERTMDIHPAIAFGAAVTGGYLFGATGALLGIPVAAIIQAIASSYLQRQELVVSHRLLTDEDEAIEDTDIQT
jgi:predicted PurR-regulated permease PerM